MILVSVPGAPAAVAWEVSSGRSGLAADVFGSWRAVGTQGRSVVIAEPHDEDPGAPQHP